MKKHQWCAITLAIKHIICQVDRARRKQSLTNEDKHNKYG